jgi:uncharacterized protein YyaL (SSP411 family)
MEITGAITLAVLMLGLSSPQGAPAAEANIEWQSWSDSIFDQAKKEGRFVLLDLGTVWCHWCHVMDEVTYKDAKVIELIRSRYLAVRVDADSRPDLSSLYEEYGWPATIVFGPDKGEIVKRRGYIAPKPMVAMLQAIIDDPTPGPSVLPEGELAPSDEAALSAAMRQTLRDTLTDAYDPKNLGWGTIQKWLDWDTLEYSMAEALRGDKTFERMARETLGAQLNLMDPVWGGVYQYSTDGDWKHPHFEKIMQMQAEDLRIYSTAYSLWHDPAYLKAAKQIFGYLKTFLTSPEGAFYTSQDADLVPGEHGGEYFQLGDAERRQRGVPRIDTHIYARENGWAINALATLYAATAEQEYLDAARRAAEWIVTHRALPNGGFHHDENDSAGPYLGDALFMGRAFLTLYTVTAEREWLRRAEDAIQFIATNFKAETGYTSSVGRTGLKSKPQVDENVVLVRLANLMAQYTGESEYASIAKHAMRFLSAPGVVDRRGFLVAGILLADREIGAAPLHLTIVGRKTDPAAQALFRAALKQPVSYKRLEWWDSADGPLPNPDVEYPQLERAAAFICKQSSCSAPVYVPEKIGTVAGLPSGY